MKTRLRLRLGELYVISLGVTFHQLQKCRICRRIIYFVNICSLFQKNIRSSSKLSLQLKFKYPTLILLHIALFHAIIIFRQPKYEYIARVNPNIARSGYTTITVITSIYKRRRNSNHEAACYYQDHL